MKIIHLCGLSVLLSGMLPAIGADVPKTMRLASLEWMPFAGGKLPNDGISGAVAAEVAKQIGSSVQVDYMIWKDAVATGESNPAFAGYFPVFYTAEREQKKCHLSASIGSSTTGIGYLKETPVQWSSPADLKSLKIGVVEGYANDPVFDDAIKQGAQQVDVSNSDTNNIKKLVTKKVPAIVIDKLVLRYMTMKSPMRDSVMFHEHVFSRQTLHVCFQRTPAGKAMQEAFDAGLKKIDLPKFETAYFKRLEASAQ